MNSCQENAATPQDRGHSEFKKDGLYTWAGALGIWFLFTFVQWLLWELNNLISPATVQRYNRLWFVVAGVAAVAFVVHQRPTVFSFSSFRPRWADIPIAAGVAYVDVNCRYLVLSPPFEVIRYSALEIAIVVAALPVIEEILCRGVVLSSWLSRMHVVAAVLLSSALFALFHLSFWPALIGEVFISILYIVRGRSLAASLLGHVFANALVYFPTAILIARWRHIT